MIRKIIKIDEEKCNGCGLCAKACHEGAIDIINGKAKLVRENFCDGLGDCFPNCPTGAITFEEREAPAYDEKAVEESKKNSIPKFAGCPGTRMRMFDKNNNHKNENAENGQENIINNESELRQWPCQIKLVSAKAEFFDNAKLLIAADCTAYAYANMHKEFMKGRITLIGCPKLDDIDYSEKLTEILTNNNVKSVTLVRMEVPCCGGLKVALEKALKNCGKLIEWRVVTISCDGRIIDS